jgi:putative flippase GtrA
MPGTLAESFERLRRVYQTPSGKKMVRYTMVSVVSTIVSLGVLGLVFGVAHLWSEVPSAVFANAVATVPSYYLNRRWAWGKAGRSHLVKEVLPFWLVSFAGLALSTWAAAMARDFSDSHNLHHFGHTVVVLGANLAAYGVLWVGKFLLFEQLFRHRPMAEAHSEVEVARNETTQATDVDTAQVFVPDQPEIASVRGQIAVESGSVAEVGALEGDAEVPFLERLDHRL